MTVWKPDFKNRRSLIGRGLMVVSLAGILIYGATTRRQWFQGNFGVVEPNRVFRSAQPTSNLKPLITEHNIASVLNLRGGSLRDPWYADELTITKELGVAFYDLSMSATKRPSRAQLLTLIDLFKRCKYPLLIHCRQGADRTGLVSGLYLLSEREVAPESARDQFTIAHGHFPLFGPEHLHEPLDEYANYLKARGLAHTSERFHEWVRNSYVAEDELTAIKPLETGPRVRR